MSAEESDGRDTRVPELDQYRMQNSMMDKAVLKMAKKPPVQASMVEQSLS